MAGLWSEPNGRRVAGQDRLSDVVSGGCRYRGTVGAGALANTRSALVDRWDDRALAASERATSAMANASPLVELVSSSDGARGNSHLRARGVNRWAMYSICSGSGLGVPTAAWHLLCRVHARRACCPEILLDTLFMETPSTRLVLGVSCRVRTGSRICGLRNLTAPTWPGITSC
jgi:hypothetical protein